MTKDEALDLALKALENLFGIPDKFTGEGGGDVAVWRLGGSYRAQQAITAIKQARSAPVQDLTDEEKSDLWAWSDYTTPPAAPVQEPVAWHDKIIGMEVSMDVSTGDDDIDHRVYGQVYEVMLAYDGGPDVIFAIESERNFTTPPAAQRQWVGLTQDEFRDFASTFDYGTGGLIRAIEAKLKEKNT